MKMAKAVILPLLVTAAIASGAGPAAAQLPAPPPLPALPTIPPPPPVAAMFAEQTWPGNETKQDAFNNMANEVNTGWATNGLQSTLIGANIGFGIGCLSIFPNFIAGCIIGTAVGVVAGAATGIGSNPNVVPSIEKFVATP
jgi:hypothetical protein